MPRPFDLVHDPIPICIRSIAVPASTGMFFQTMYNVVDTYYAGTVSTIALASLSLSFPAFLIILSLSSGISSGSTALIGNALGSDDEEYAKTLTAQSISFAIITSIVLTVLGIVFSEALLRSLGASGEYLEICHGYLVILFAGSGFFVLANVLNAPLTAHGDSTRFRNYLVLGFFLNLILDPWFLYGGFGLPPLGFKGIALATLVTQAIGCIYIGYSAYSQGYICPDCYRQFWPKARVYREIAEQGFPTSLSMMTVAVGNFIIIYYVSDFGSDAVAAFGVALRIEQIALLPSIGLNIATLSIVARNNGAGEFQRVLSTIVTSIMYSASLMLVAMLIFYMLAESLVSCFSDDPTVIHLGANYLRIVIWIMFAYSLFYICSSALQGLKRPRFTVLMAALRLLVLPPLVFPFFAYTLGFGLNGIWYGLVLNTWIAAVLSVGYTVALVRARMAASSAADATSSDDASNDISQEEGSEGDAPQAKTPLKTKTASPGEGAQPRSRDTPQSSS